ncbi:MAG: protocatechuate 3,4-dioxygenase [Blastocatellia bacterium]|nr:protocatechuate 3,4-dioxygenase [Blastocatellia bacterium]
MGNNQAGNFTRRSFTRHASLFAMALPSLQLGLLSMWGCRGQSQVRAALDTNSLDVPSKIATVSNNEPGEPLIISGTIYAPDGRTPLPGMNLWVYQTDATGHYSKLSESGGDNRNTRIHGLLRTDADGRYEFRTIKPAPYPGRNNPAHIHAYVSGPGYPEYWIDEFLFEGDPFITPEIRAKLLGEGSFASILKLSRGADCVLRGFRDIKVERCSQNCTGR